MTVFLVLALLASNIFLAKMLLSKDTKKTSEPSDIAENNVSEGTVEKNYIPIRIILLMKKSPQL